LQACSDHRACQSSPNPAFVPTRLLRIGRPDELVCCLVDQQDLGGKPVEYFALSHCWGSNVEITLTANNYPLMKKGICLETLSKNFRDAIAATRALGVEYLWIDCLCIIQDSPEDEDWNRESVLMMDVFANAACTISATASASSQGGCFRDRMGVLSTCKLITSATSELRIEIPAERQTIGELFLSRVEAAPLMRRGWVFQERLLSRRIIHFCSDMLLFECNTLQASEEDPKGSNYEKVPYLLVGGRIQSSTSTASSASPDPVRVDRWYELVASYSRGALTKQTDKLVAISGIAGLIEKTSHAQYVAGLWSNVAPEFGLLWRDTSPRSRRHETYIAPTWSWASLDGQI
ncbi:heterokaryon incompatibility protein-domain-containing protein, partial [Cercophora newfieldiana]